MFALVNATLNVTFNLPHTTRYVEAFKSHDPFHHSLAANLATQMHMLTSSAFIETQAVISSSPLSFIH
jgi:hypothetical protein